MDLDPQTKFAVKQRVRECLLQAAEYCGKPIPKPEIDYSLRGLTAGQAFIFRSGSSVTCKLRINVALCQANLEDYLQQAIPHEIAHFVVVLMQKGKQKPKPHGPEWQTVMRQCFGLQPKRCHNYAVERPPRKPRKTYAYTCGCRELSLSTIRHNRITKGMIYNCLRCKGVLRPVGAVQPASRKSDAPGKAAQFTLF